ncbi:MAG: hypothetical protein ACR2NJ_04860 [Acidimicrobiales bacterium]
MALSLFRRNQPFTHRLEPPTALQVIWPSEPVVVTPRSAFEQNSPARYRLPAGDLSPGDAAGVVVGTAVMGPDVVGTTVTRRVVLDEAAVVVVVAMLVEVVTAMDDVVVVG